MGHCQKCQGSLRYDREFPGMVCQMCGAVYYLNSYADLLQARTGKRSSGGWHQAKVAV